jgi:predicted nuclease of predicted toxin-antitoxin system
MTFLIDAQLPPALVNWLRERGHAAEHVADVGLTDAEDVDIWNRALQTGSIIVTKDEDFAERAARDNSGPVILWLRIGNSTNRALIDWLNSRWPVIVELLDSGNRLIEVR